MRRTGPVVALAAAWWLFTELAAVWGPSLITIFGQAAETPAELMGLFALGCVVASFAVFAAVGRAPWVALVIAVIARIVLAWSSGGQVQLYAASAGVAAALAWLAVLAARHGPVLAPGLAGGWLAVALVGVLSGSWWPVWRGGVVGAVEVTVLVLVAVVSAPAGLTASGSLSRRQAWTLLPLGLVAGIAVVNSGRASAAGDLGPLALVLGCVLALLLTSWPPERPGRIRTTVLAGVVATGVTAISLLVTGGGDLPGSLTAWNLLVLIAGPAGCALLLMPDAAPSRDMGHGHAALGRAALGYAVLGGAVLWVVLFFAYYAGYDLGYRADPLIVAVAAVLAVTAVVASVRAAPPQMAPASTRLSWVAAAGAVALVLAIAGSLINKVPSRTVAQGGTVRVVAYNLRMGYGMDGRFDAKAVAEVLKSADVALLSEVDRGWLLNGGQDQLAILARLTGKRLYFSPAADPVWGDAVLTDLPVREVRGHPLASYGAVTGAQVLSVRVGLGGRDAWMVATHVQPTGSRKDGTIDQARDIAHLVGELGADATPVVLGGDFNFEPSTPSFDAITGAGFTDALAGARPVLTSQPGHLTSQIDHLFLRGQWVVEGAGSLDVDASDHLPVWAELRPGP